VYPYADTLAGRTVAEIASQLRAGASSMCNGFIPFNLFVIALAVIAAPALVAVPTPWRRCSRGDCFWPAAAFLSRYWFWNGGLCFGSRYLLFMIPFSALGLSTLPSARRLRCAPAWRASSHSGRRSNWPAFWWILGRDLAHAIRGTQARVRPGGVRG
jgi:hypothetical protein